MKQFQPALGKKTIIRMALVYLIVGFTSNMDVNCSAGESVTHIIIGKARPSIIPSECVKIFLRPPTNFEEIAILSSTMKKSSIFEDQGKMDEFLRALKEDASKLGANGILLDQVGDIAVGGKASVATQFAVTRVNYDPKIYKTISALAIYCPGLEEVTLAEALLGPDLDSVVRTIRMLRDAKYKWAANLILPCLKTHDSRVLREACRTLGVIGDTNQVQAIESLFGNKDTDVVVDACRALVKLDSKASLPVILPLLNDERTDVARVACEALGTLGNESNIPALETLLNDKRRSVRSEAKSSVKELHKKR